MYTPSLRQTQLAVCTGLINEHTNIRNDSVKFDVRVFGNWTHVVRKTDEEGDFLGHWRSQS